MNSSYASGASLYTNDTVGGAPMQLFNGASIQSVAGAPALMINQNSNASTPTGSIGNVYAQIPTLTYGAPFTLSSWFYLVYDANLPTQEFHGYTYMVILESSSGGPGHNDTVFTVGYFQASGGSSEYLSVPYGTTPAGPGAGPGFMGPPPLNAWTHLAITVAVDGTVTGYLNGAAYGSQIQPVVANVTRSQNYVGLSQWGQNNYNFDGYIADLQLIPSVLSPDDVLNLYNGQPCAP